MRSFPLKLAFRGACAEDRVHTMWIMHRYNRRRDFSMTTLLGM